MLGSVFFLTLLIGESYMMIMAVIKLFFYWNYFMYSKCDLQDDVLIAKLRIFLNFSQTAGASSPVTKSAIQDEEIEGLDTSTGKEWVAPVS